MVSRKSNSFEFTKNPSIKSCFPEIKSVESSEKNSLANAKISHHLKTRSYDVGDCTALRVEDNFSLRDVNHFSAINVEPPPPSQVVLYNNALFNSLPPKRDHHSNPLSDYQSLRFRSFISRRNLSLAPTRKEINHDDVLSNLQPSSVAPSFILEEEPILPSTSSADMTGEMRNGRHSRHVTLYIAALKGDWKTAKVYLRWNPHAVRATITRGHETVLHVAVGSNHPLFVKKLVKRMTPDDLALQNKVGNTALCFAAISGITEIAEVLVNKNKSLPLVRGSKGATPIYMAALLGRREMVWYLYSVTDDNDLSAEDRIGLLVAAITSNLLDIALELIQKHPELAIARDGNGETALHVLSRKPGAFYSGTQLGHRQRCIYSWISVNFCPKVIGKNRFYTYVSAFLIAALSTMKSLMWNSFVYICLLFPVPEVNLIYKIKLRHIQAIELVKQLWQLILNLDNTGLKELIRTPRRLIFTAAEFGIVEFITILIQSHPDLIWKVDKQSRSIFHIAVLYRQTKVFNLIHELGALKDFIAIYKDEDNNNMLHLAGKLPPPSRLNTDSGAALQLRHELLWFKEVERIVQPMYTEMENSEGITPQCLFSNEHKQMKREGEKWMKDTASSCMVVATLIATVMFAAAFTVPGGNNSDTGRPIFLHTRSFMVFVISDALSLFASATSILIFLSILTSRYAEEDFLQSLPNKLIMGLATLFISITTMMVSFSAALFIILLHGMEWATVPIVIVASIPVSIFASLQFPLVFDILSHSYTRFHPSNNHLLS
ncbi:ankyrin repeat-containing protein ITN1-like [Euphorbia lathyris]|uniref:ankyrin repeat-containing protein ITN1-like n=1 Tax=Euphorbia lathyris TaxID=212925 RepID=UPI003313BFD8